jgi:hypothetical protein
MCMRLCAAVEGNKQRQANTQVSQCVCVCVASSGAARRAVLGTRQWAALQGLRMQLWGLVGWLVGGGVLPLLRLRLRLRLRC